MAEPRSFRFPPEGIEHDGILLRLPTLDDVNLIAPAFTDPTIGGSAGLPEWGAEELRAQIANDLPAMIEAGEMLPLTIEVGGEVQGGGTIHHVDWAEGQAEIGYWLLHEARGKGIATKAARSLAEYVFSLGLERVEARVDAGNTDSERVVERAGFTREGVLRSVRARHGRKDITLYSLLPGE